MPEHDRNRLVGTLVAFIGPWKPAVVNTGETWVSQPSTGPSEKSTMIKLTTQSRNVATVFALSCAMPFALLFGAPQLSRTVVAQESFDSYPTLGLESVLDGPELDLSLIHI